MRVTKELHFCAAHRLMDYDGDCRFVHGHNYKVEVTVEGPVGPNGILMDFCEFDVFQRHLDATYDHRLMLYHQDPLVTTNQLVDPTFRVVLIHRNPTAEVLAHLILDELQDILRREFISIVGCTVQVVKVVVWETDRARAEATLEDVDGS